MTQRTLLTLAATAAVALAAPAVADAVTYPPPANPKATVGKPKGPFSTLRVGKAAKYKTIQAAVNAAKPGDTIRVADGRYREGVRIKGSGKRYLKIIGNPANPEKVLLEGKGLKGLAAQQGFYVDGANEVGIQGFKAQNYRANGFFIVNAVGYTLDRLIAEKDGVYGIYAFNSKGGTMTNSVAYHHNDAGFYIGQTPAQTKPVRTIVRNVQSWGNVIGFSGTNMRYVTITGSKFFNNGTGIVPNALDTEKFAPPEDNVITSNEIFWNNFNYKAGAPFTLKTTAVGEIPYPVGVGVLLFGGRRHLVESNIVWGNWLVGIGMLQQLLLKQTDAKDLVGNQITNNVMATKTGDRNGRDIFYDGNGTGNCIGGNASVSVTVPANASTFVACPFSGANAFLQSAQLEAIGWVSASDPTASWLKSAQTPIAGIEPLETFASGKTFGPRKP